MNDDAYSQRQSALDADYERAYAEWIAGMSAEERAEMERRGLHVPLLPPAGSGCRGGDLADLPIASESPDMVGEIDRREARRRAQEPAGAAGSSGEGGDSPEDAEALWDALRRLIGEILSQPNRSLALECVALASGLSFLGDSETEIGRRHRVSRAAVSKRCVELTKRIGLPPSRAMRSLTAREAYRAAQLKIRAAHEAIPTDEDPQPDPAPPHPARRRRRRKR